MTNSPLVTVLMPTYKGAKYLPQTIGSILSQTYTNYEFLIINDGSPDESATILQQYTDSRIRIITNEVNKGISYCSNLGVDEARGKYIVRQDHDDISLPNRIEKLVDLIESDENIGVASSWIARVRKGSKTRIWKCPTENIDIKMELLSSSSLFHPASILRRSVIIENNIRYNLEYKVANDYKLWTDLMPYCSFANIDEPLLEYMSHPGQTSLNNVHATNHEDYAIKKDLLARISLVLSKSEEEYFINSFLRRIKSYLHCNIAVIKNIGEICSTLLQSNERSHFYPNKEFSRFIAEKWEEYCMLMIFHQIKIYEVYKVYLKKIDPFYVPLSILVFYKNALSKKISKI